MMISESGLLFRATLYACKATLCSMQQLQYSACSDAGLDGNYEVA